MFFSGRLPRPPWETRNRVAALVKKWDRGYIQSAVDRFQFDTLQRRFQTFIDLWDRGLRVARRGTRDRAVRRAAAEGGAESRRQPDAKVVHVTAFQDPMREMDKLHTLYDSLMDARRESGDDVVPFHRFAALVKDQVTKLKSDGSEAVAFRVAVVEGKVNFTARGVKGGEGSE